MMEGGWRRGGGEGAGVGPARAPGSGGAEEGVQDCPACGAARLGLEGKGANMTNFKVSASQPAFPGVLAYFSIYEYV